MGYRELERACGAGFPGIGFCSYSGEFSASLHGSDESSPGQRGDFQGTAVLMRHPRCLRGVPARTIKATEKWADECLTQSLSLRTKGSRHENMLRRAGWSASFEQALRDWTQSREAV